MCDWFTVQDRFMIISEAAGGRDVGELPYTGDMTQRFAEYVEAGYELTPDERLEAARMLRLSVDQDTDSKQADIDGAWDDVIDRRVGEVVSGQARLVDGRDGLAQIRAELTARRK